MPSDLLVLVAFIVLSLFFKFELEIVLLWFVVYVVFNDLHFFDKSLYSALAECVQSVACKSMRLPSLIHLPCLKRFLFEMFFVLYDL